MKKEQVTAEELEKSLQYLEAFAKGQKSEEIEEKVEEKVEEEPDDELYAAHKKRLSAYLDKAMAHKGFMDKIKKGEPLPDEAFDDLEEEKQEKKKVEEVKEEEKKEEKIEEGCHGDVKKGNEDELNKAQEIEDLIKAKVNEALDAQKKESQEIIKGLEDKIKALEDQPVKKTLIKGADAITLKKAITGEKEDNKTLLSISLQKGKVSEALFEAYDKEEDEMKKGILGEAVAEFESTGNYISPEVVKIMDDKGYKFIK